MQAFLCICGQLAVEEAVSDCVGQLACVRLCQRLNLPGFCVRIVSGSRTQNESLTTDGHGSTQRGRAATKVGPRVSPVGAAGGVRVSEEALARAGVPVL